MENFDNKKYIPFVDMTKYQLRLSRHHKLLSVIWGGLLTTIGISGVAFSAGNIIRLGYALVNDPDAGLYFAVLNLLPIFLIIAIFVGILDEGVERFSYLHPIDTESQKPEVLKEMPGTLSNKIYLYKENEQEIYHENIKTLILVISEQIVLLLFANANPFTVSNRYILIIFSSLVFAYCLMELWYRTIYRKIKLNN